MFKEKQSGFTLMELLITVAIVSILLSIAGPNFLDFFDRKRLVGTAEELASNLQFTRAESLARHVDLHMTGNASGNATWVYGIGYGGGDGGAGCNIAQVLATAVDACVLIVDDGLDDGNPANDITLVDGTTTADPNDLVLKRISSVDHPGIKMSLESAAPVGGAVTFDHIRGVVDAIDLGLESPRGNKLWVRMNSMGSVRICVPAGSSMVGYSAC